MNEIKKWTDRLNYIQSEYKFPEKEIRLMNEENRLHSSTTFAYQSPTRLTEYKNGKKHGLDITFFGSMCYYYEGILVPNKYITNPKTVTYQEVINEKNTEIRYVGIKVLGIENILQHGKIINRNKSKDMLLVHFDLKTNEPLAILKVTNSTPELDGSYKDYFLTVPPTIKTCTEAVAWTFRKDTKEYNPTVET